MIYMSIFFSRAQSCFLLPNISWSRFSKRKATLCWQSSFTYHSLQCLWSITPAYWCWPTESGSYICWFGQMDLYLGICFVLLNKSMQTPYGSPWWCSAASWNSCCQNKHKAFFIQRTDKSPWWHDPSGNEVHILIPMNHDTSQLGTPKQYKTMIHTCCDGLECKIN